MPTTSQTPRRILIIGAGVSGLALALALKRVGRSTGLDLHPIIFEANGPSHFSEAGPHYVLWRWAVEILIEMGCGGRLSKIASPLMYYTSRESESEEVVTQWPPADRTKDPIDAQIGLDTALPPMVGVRRCDLVRMLMLAISGVRDDLVVGDDYLPTSANNSDLVPDPIEDLDADLAQGRWFENEGFYDIMPELVLGEKLDNFSFDSSTGEVMVEFASGRIERGFMLVGADGADSAVRRLLHQNTPARNPLLSLSPSPPKHILSYAGACVIYGITRLHVPPVDTPDILENGTPIPDLLRDDVHEFCPDGRSVSIVGKGMSFTVTHLGNGMLGWSLIVAQSEPNKHASDYAMQRTRRLLSESIAKNPRQSILMLAQQNQSSLSQLSGIQTDFRSAEDKWGSRQVPGRLSPEAHDDDDDLSLPPMPKPLSAAPNGRSVTLGRHMGGGLRPPHMRSVTSPDPPAHLNNFDGEGPSAPDVPTNGRRHRGPGAGVNLSDPVLPEKLKARAGEAAAARSPTASRNPRRVSMPLSPLPFDPVAPPSRVPNLFGPQDPLTGADARTLALRLSQGLALPHPCYAIMARTDPKLTAIEDIADMADDPLDTLSIPASGVTAAGSLASLASKSPRSPSVTTLFGEAPAPHEPPDVKMNHVGRVMLVGDAAHPVAVTASGGMGAGLALTDAALLAKLLAKHLATARAPPASPSAATADIPNGHGSSGEAVSEAEALRKTAADMDRERCGLGAGMMREARAEAGWDRSESPLVRGLLRIGRLYTPTTWTRSSYAQMLTRGAVKSGLPSLTPIPVLD
ncbi:hypothetical protein HK405_001386 [Cladochytrium tenue]|nr:hypothetical protein HK405_001386 [Cladochytrium tenue]